MKLDRDRMRRGLWECVGIPTLLGAVILACLLLCQALNALA